MDAMNKKLVAVFCLLSMLLSSFSLFSVKGKIGTVGTTFEINDVSIGAVSTEYHDAATSNHMFHVGNYWYKMGMEYVTGDAGSRWFWLSTIDTNLSDWSDCSEKVNYHYTTKGTYNGAMWAHYQAVYDAEQGVFHCVWANQFQEYVYYVQGTPNSTGGVTFGARKTLLSIFVNGNVDICLMNGKPVVVVSTKTASDFDFATWVLFSSDEDGTSWTNTYADTYGELTFTYILPQVHAINSTHVYVIIEEEGGGSDPLYGFYANIGLNATTAITQITTDNVQSFTDVNAKAVSGYSTVSVNTVTPTSYAELISIIYINTTKSVKTVFWNVTSETISGDEEIIYTHSDTYSPIHPLIAMESNMIWGGFWNRTGGSSCTFVLYERNPLTGTWGDPTEVDAGSWSAGELIPSCMNKQPGSSLIVTQQVGSIVYGCDVEALLMDITADFEDVDNDGADWVFTDWKYYRFNATVYRIVENISIAFLVPTGEENIFAEFFSDGDDWIYSSNMTYESREGEPCKLKAGSWSQNETAETTSATFDIWFESRIMDVWSGGVDAYGFYDGGAYSLVESDLFRIYSKGGFEMNFASTGTAGKLAGGTPFSLYGTNGSIVYNEIWYRDGQHIKLMPDIHFLTGLDPFYVRYGVDYSLGNGTWLEGWNIYINPKFVSYTGIFAANVWINMTNLWNNRGSFVTSEDLYMFYHGSVSGVGDAGHWKSWVDLWFSDKNASRVGAGRYNAYEFPMIDSADLWLRWLANNWGVKDNVLKEMSVQVPLLDSDNSTVISSEKIKMMRFWCELEVDDADSGQFVSIENYEAFDVTHSRELPLVGMSDPVFDETLIPIIGQKGILGALWSMFAGFGQWMSENVIFGGLSLWSTFVNFLDTIAGLFGAPTFFSDLFSWLAELFTYLGTSAEYVLEILADIFSLFNSLLGIFLSTVGDLISSLVTTVTMITDMFGGAYGAGVNIWEYLNLSMWLQLVIIMYPLYLVILWDTNGMDAVIQQLTWIFGLLTWVFGFLVSIIQFILQLVGRIIESIPVVE